MLPRQAKARLIQSVVGGNCVRLTNRRQSDSEDRSKSNRLAPKNSRHPIRQAPQLFKLQSCTAGVKGAEPLAFSWGFKGAILSRERMAPLLRTPARCGRTKDAAPSGCSPFRARRVPKTALARLCCKRGTTFRFKKRQERAAFPPLLPASNADAPSCASSPFFHLGQSMPPRPKRCGARKCGRGTLLISHTLLNYMGYLQKGRRRAWTATKLSPRPTTS